MTTDVVSKKDFINSFIEDGLRVKEVEEITKHQKQKAKPEFYPSPFASRASSKTFEFGKPSRNGPTM